MGEIMVGDKPKIKCVNTIICQTSDMDRSVAFYRDVLGLTPGHLTPYWSDFTLGDIRIGIHPPFQGSTPPYALPQKGWILGLDVDDLKALRKRLEEAGARINGDYHDIPGGVILDFEDPDGNALEAGQTGISAKDLL
jgi:predicted enzyme related to lactoylglutathione lyase